MPQSTWAATESPQHAVTTLAPIGVQGEPEEFGTEVVGRVRTCRKEAMGGRETGGHPAGSGSGPVGVGSGYADGTFLEYLCRMDIPADSSRRPRPIAQVRTACRRRRLSPRTEQAYLGWIRRYVHYHGTRHPAELGEGEVLAFLNWLVVDRRVAHSTQMQALSGLLFLYRDVVGRPLGEVRGLLRARGPKRLPVVPSRSS